MKEKLLTTKNVVLMGMFGALAGVLMLFEFPLPFLAPSFYGLDVSEVPVLIGAFAMGPLAGAAIELIKILLNLVMKGSTTAGVGEVANFLIGCAYVKPEAVQKRSEDRRLLPEIRFRLPYLSWHFSWFSVFCRSMRPAVF